MPIERFLAQRDSEDSSDSFAAAALDLPLPPPTAADFPELPRAAPTPKMTKAEKAMANKINALLLSDVKGKIPAWVENLKTETQTLHSSQDLVVYTDGAYHHADNRASYAIAS